MTAHRSRAELVDLARRIRSPRTPPIYHFSPWNVEQFAEAIAAGAGDPLEVANSLPRHQSACIPLSKKDVLALHRALSRIS